MNDRPVRASPRRLPARPSQIVLRVAVVVSGLAAIVATRAATNDPIVALEGAVVVVALLCAITPDTHLGLLGVVLIGTNWLVVVDDSATPWAIGVALAVASFHTSMSAASVAPIAAGWTRAMRRRWTRRFVVLAATVVPVWSVVALVEGVDIGGSSVVMAGALFVVAIAGLWARHGALTSRPAASPTAER